MANSNDWHTPGDTIQLPFGAGPNDAAIILGGGNMPDCMSGYASAILWRPRNSQTGVLLNDAPYFFMAQEKNGSASVEHVDFGALLYDPLIGYCDYNVMQRYDITNFGPNQQERIFIGVVPTAGGTLPRQGGVVTMFYDGTNRVYGQNTPGLANYAGDAVRFSGGTLTWEQGSQNLVGSGGTPQNAYIPYGIQDSGASGITALVAANSMVGGTAITITTLRTTDQIVVTGDFDFERIAAGAGVCVGELYVDGVRWLTAGSPRQAIFSATVTGERATTPQQWLVSGLTVGSHTLQLGVHTTGAAGIWRANAIHTSIQVDPRF